MLTFSQMESVTNDYFLLDNGKAHDIYTDSSYLLNLFLKQQKGMWKRTSGGLRVRIPLKYDGNEAGFYSRGDTLSSDKRVNVNAAYFTLAHAYGNATILRLDTLENAGPEAQVELVMDEVETAQTSVTKVLAESLYDLPSGSTNRLTGLRHLCNETTSLAYGAIAEEDLVAEDGSTPWEGKFITTSAGITTTIIRDMSTQAKIRDGANGKPDICTMPEELFNVIVDTLQIQQRFTKSEDTAKAGFNGVEFEGKILTPDDYCPAGHMFLLNSKHVGFVVHNKGFFTRGPWHVVQNSPEDKTMKIYFDGNLICSNRKAHIGRSNLS